MGQRQMRNVWSDSPEQGMHVRQCWIVTMGAAGNDAAQRRDAQRETDRNTQNQEHKIQIP